jgi:hypothetical protein
MPKSRNRKNHKKKVAARNKRIRDDRNRMMKFYQMMEAQQHYQQEMSKREHIIETIYNNKPEIAKTNEEGVLCINEETLEIKDGILLWKDSGNPLLSGLEPLENYPNYTEEVVNDLLASIQHKQQAAVDNTGMTAEVVENVEDELGISDEFELIEDEDFIEDAVEVEEDSETDDDTKDNE